MSGIYRTRAELDSALQAGSISFAEHASLSQYFNSPTASQNSLGSAGKSSPAIQALSKMVAEGKCDALDIVTKIKAGTSPEFLAAHGGMDLGEATLAAMDEDRHIHTPAPKISTRADAIAEIKKFEANTNDLGDQVVAQLLRKQHGVWEVL